jgi:CHAT domain-containing protein
LRSRVITYLAEYNRRPIDRRGWLNELDSLLSWLWDCAMGPLLDGIKGCDEAILIPGSLLGLLPLHAAWTKDAAKPSGRRYALDTVNLRFAPNARVLEGRRERQPQERAIDAILAFSNPEPVSAPALSCAEPEVDAAVSRFAHARVLAGKDASLDEALSEIANYPVLHFACHGASDFVEPLNGGLVLADDDVLTLRHFLDLSLPETRLAILSACETGVPSSQLADEVFSLSSGLLGAGVKGVIASLWPVADLSTMMLMTRFYQFWRDQKLSPAAALQSAQMWVRDTSNSEKRDFFKQMLPDFGAIGRPSLAADALYKILALSDPGAYDYASPFHWAAFTYTGV